MDAPTIAALSSLAVALVAVLALAAPVYLRLGRLESEIKAGRDRADLQHEASKERQTQTLDEIRRLVTVFSSHTHARDGDTLFRTPP